MSKYVFNLVKFSDGDWRVYRTDVATKERVDDWSCQAPHDPDDIQAEIVLAGRKKVLIGMAKLARADYVEEQVRLDGGNKLQRETTRRLEENAVDRTKAGRFP